MEPKMVHKHTEIHSTWLASPCFLEMKSEYRKTSEDNCELQTFCPTSQHYFLNLSLHKGYQQVGFFAAKLKDKIEKIRVI